MTPRRVLAETFWWAASAALYAVLAWVFAPQLVFGPLRDVNDFPNAFTYAEWIRRSFPLMPFWFPYQGAGISPSSAYAVGPEYAVAALARAGVDLVFAARLLAFLAFPIGALGVAASGRAFGLSRLGGFASGLISLLPPAAWNLTVYGGLFANIFAAALVPWAVASTVAYVRWPHRRLDRRGVMLFSAAAVSTAAAFLAHPVIAVVPLALGALAALGTNGVRLARTVAVVLVATLLAAGAIYAFAEYTGVTLSDSSGLPEASALPRSS
jgi:hypothetical protein